MRGFTIFSLYLSLLSVGAVAPVTGTTLEHLSLREMARQSTSIARVTVVSAHAVCRRGDIYTLYRLRTMESLKSPAAPPLFQELAVPGGVAGGIRQAVTGAPEVRVGGEYVMFLWTGRSGLTQITGLSQGLFSVQARAGKEAVLQQAPADENSLDRRGRPLREAAVELTWSELKSQLGLRDTRPALKPAAEGR